MKFGLLDVADLRYGGQPIVAAYIGTTKVWPVDNISFAGNLIAQSLLAGQIVVIKALNGNLIAVSTNSAGLTRAVAFTASQISVSTFSGSLNVLHEVLFAGSFAGLSTIAAELKAIRALVAAQVVISTMAGNAVVVRALAAAQAALSSIGGAFIRAAGLAATIAAVSVLSASLTTTPSGPTSLTFVASANSQASTISVPGSAQADDIAILIDGVTTTKSPTDVIPSGWTGIGSLYWVTSKNGGGVRCSRKILVSGDVGASVTGMNETTEAKVMLVFRPNAPIGTVTVGTVNNEATTGNPSSQTVTASGQPSPLLIIGGVVASGGSAAFSTASPAFDATVVTGGLGETRAGYKIYNSSPANHTIDANDLGDDTTLVSFYLRVS